MKPVQRSVLVLPDGRQIPLRRDRPPEWQRASIEGQIQAHTLGGSHHRFVVLELADGGLIELTVDTARQARIDVVDDV